MSVDLFIQILRISAGIGLFLFAMYLQEEALKNLSGRSFKIFLQRITRNSFGAVIGGMVITAILQSSSVVSLMVLAFVGAGIFTMKNAMGIILGANLGSTVYSWLVATLGFKMDISLIAYPLVSVGGLLLVVVGNRKNARSIAFFLLGFGLLFIGLSFMKTALEAQSIDFTRYSEMPLVVFLLIGFVITLIVQSSSVTIALTLSALNAGAVTFPVAVAIALGSESGTTIKTLLGSLGGTASKKRVALGNLFFNIVLTVGAFLLLRPALSFITEVLGIRDPLIGLVSFSTLVNLTGVLVFLPFLGPFTAFLKRFFKDADASASAFIGHASVEEPVTALDLFSRETAYFIHNSMAFNLSLFEISTLHLRVHPEFKSFNEERRFFSKTPEEMYDFMKQLQGELQAFYIKLSPKLEGPQSERLSKLIDAVRNAMYSVKSMKDVGSNISNLRRSSKDIKFDFFMHHKTEISGFYHELDIMLANGKSPGIDTFLRLFEDTRLNYDSALSDFYKAAKQHPLEDLDFTTAIIFNRELYTSNKALLMAVKDLLLDETQARQFNGTSGSSV